MRPYYDLKYSRRITLYHVSKVMPLLQNDAFYTSTLKIATLCKLAICALLQFPVSATKIDTFFRRKVPEYNRSLLLLIQEKMRHKWVANHHMLKIRGFFSFEKDANVSTSNSLDFNKTTQTE